MNNLDFALNYLEHGLSVFPVNGKIPLVKWEQYSKEKPIEQEVTLWWLNWPAANIGIATGAVSDKVVIDVDGGDTPALPKTATVETSPGRFHYYFRHPGFEVPNSAKIIAPNCDVRGDGGYVVAPPSRHFKKETGEPDYRYRWVIKPKETGFAELPEWIVEKITSKKNVVAEAAVGVPEGQRNNSAVVIIGSLMSRYPPEQWESICWPLTIGWNLTNQPPLNENELRSVFDSVRARESIKSKGQTIYNSDFLTIRLISFEELLKREFPPNKWVVENLIPENGITCISGKPKAGKSILSLHLAVSLATGKKLFGEFNVEQGSVLLIAKEDPERLIQERLKKLTEASTLPIYFYNSPHLFLDSDKYLNELQENIKKYSVKVVIIDSFRRIFRGEENSSQVVSDVHNRFKKLLELGLSIVFIHHHGKEGFFKREAGDKLRGSSDILAFIDSLLIVERKDSNNLKITQAALRSDKPVAPFVIGFPDFNDEHAQFSFLGFVEEEKEKIDLAKADIQNLLASNGESKQIDIILNLKDNHKPTTVKNALKELCESKILSFKTEGRKKIYFLKDQWSESQSNNINDQMTIDNADKWEEPPPY